MRCGATARGTSSTSATRSTGGSRRSPKPGNPGAVCGPAGPGVAHLINGLIDAKKERVPVIAIAGDVESSLIDTDALEELNPYQFFATAALYIGRLINPGQLHPVVTTAITTAIAEQGPTVISVPGDVAS